MFEADTLIVRADVHIVDVDPPITRTLELGMDLKLAQFHEVLQAAFGWTDSHLHQFDVGGLRYGAPEFDEDALSGRRTFDAVEVSLADFALTFDVPILVFYEYDFGDSWKHAVSLVVARREAGARYPRCIRGARSGPPEDVGGPSGYAGFLEVWRDPLDDQHEAVRRWAGRSFDPERFDLDATNKAITRAVRRSRGGGTAFVTRPERRTSRFSPTGRHVCRSALGAPTRYLSPRRWYRVQHGGTENAWTESNSGSRRAEVIAEHSNRWSSATEVEILMK